MCNRPRFGHPHTEPGPTSRHAAEPPPPPPQTTWEKTPGTSPATRCSGTKAGIIIYNFFGGAQNSPLYEAIFLLLCGPL